MSAKLKQFSGRVVRRQVGGVSKSAHMAVCLETKDETPFKLRRAGGNPFADKELEGLVGKSVEIEGRLLDPSTLLISSWREVG